MWKNSEMIAMDPLRVMIVWVSVDVDMMQISVWLLFL